MGYDPTNGDWYRMKYNEDGTVVRAAPQEGNRPIAGRVMTCIDCPRKAGGNDLVFSNDLAVEETEKKAGETRKAEEKPHPPEGS
jgi:hypothetical protein